MMKRSLPLVVPALLAVPVLLAGLGGWATITVEDLPEHVVADQPVQLTFTVRQHGVSPMRGLKGGLEARSGRLETRAAATAGTKAGQYTAQLTLPEPGTWSVIIHSGFNNNSSKLLPIRVVDRTAPVAAMQPAERGRHLFVAKGCVGCHTHRGAGAETLVEVGPDLSTRRYEADYLAKFLADPSIRPPANGRAAMPDLELKDREIAALVAFLNGGASRAVSGER